MKTLCSRCDRVTDANNFSVVLGFICDECQRAYQKLLDEDSY